MLRQFLQDSISAGIGAAPEVEVAQVVAILDDSQEPGFGDVPTVT